MTKDTVPINKQKISIDCDLSVTSLQNGIKEFKEKFGYLKWFNITASIENIMIAIKIEKYLEEHRHCMELGDEKIFFSVDRKLEPDAWEIHGRANNEYCCIYSLGA